MHTYFKMSLRNLWHNKFYALINLVGLSIAIICMLVAVLYWKDDHSFDAFHKNNPNIYRLLTNIVTKEGKIETKGGTGQVQGPAFKASIPEVENYTRVMGGDIFSDITANNKTLHLQPLFVDNSFFSIFSFPLINGNTQNVLNDAGNIVLSESIAKKFFNSVDVVGKTITVDADPSFDKLGKPLIISGVVEDPPANSSLQFDVLLSFDFMQLSFQDDNWLNAYLGTFLLLRADANKNEVLAKFNNIYKANAAAQIGNKDFDMYGYDPKISYTLQPITDIHLNPYVSSVESAEGGIINGTNPVYAYVFMGVALFILLMAAVNFININIAVSLKRSKEVAIRKIAGSSKHHIVLLFLFDAFIICFLAFLLSIISINIILPLFNELTGKQIIFSKIFDIHLLSYFIIVLIAITLLSGLYPSWVLSNFKPKEVLYNKQKLSGRNILGRGLVIFQFSLATFLLIAAIVYYGQMNFMRTKDLGYNPNNIIRTNFGGNRDYKTIHQLLINEFSKEPSITSVSFGNDGWMEDVKANGNSFKALYKNIDDHFLSLLQISLKSGRNLSSDFETDKKEGIIVNEAFVKTAGLEDPVGKEVSVNREGENQNSQKIIRGVVKDFHFGSLRNRISPMLMYMRDVPDGSMWIKFRKSRQKEAMAAIERIYKAAMPGAAYQYNFLDELNARQYFQELRWQKIITLATMLSFVVCCLGLFGLAHISTNYRSKEVGVRKVLGATVAQIVVALSVDFLKLVVIAFIIAAPLAWAVMNNWLKNFAYRVDIGASVLLMAAAIVLVTALASVIVQSVKTGLANPVKSLRTE